MVIEQAYYTSCETGLRGSKGFQFNAVSSGLDQATLAYLERYGGYAPPLSCPTRPTVEELADFPRTLTYFMLPGDYAVLARSVYVGKDYSGRYGNFFTHFLVSRFVTDLVSQLLPIDAWQAHFWKSSPVTDKTLGTLSLSDIKAGTRKIEVANFLNDGERQEHFGSLVSCVQSAPQTKRRIIIVDTDEAVAMWIAAITYVLPTHLAKQVTFTTYAKNPYNIDTLICGTTSDSDFRFTPTEMQHQFYVFDFVSNRFSKPPQQTKFSTAVSRWYQEGRSSECKHFREFAETLPSVYDMGDLDRLVDLYYLVSGQIESEEDIHHTISFINEKKIHSLPAVLNTLTAALSEHHRYSSSLSEAVSAFFAAAFHSSEVGDDQREDLVNFYVDWVIVHEFPHRNIRIVNDVGKVLDGYVLSTESKKRIVRTLEHALSSYRELPVLKATIRFAEVLGLLTEIEPSLEKLVKGVVIQEIDKPAYQDFVADLIEVEGSLRLPDVLVSFLVSRSQNRSELPHLLGILDRSQIRERIRKICSASNEKSIFLLMHGLQISSSSTKGEDLIRLLSEISSTKRFALALGDYDLLFHLCWPDGVMSPKEVMLVFNSVPEASIHSPSFLQLALSGVLQAGDVLNPSEGSDTGSAIKRLKEVVKEEVFLNAEMVKTFQKCLMLIGWLDLYMGAGGFDRECELIKVALENLPRSNSTARKQVVRTVIERYLDGQSRSAAFSAYMSCFKRLDEADSVTKVLHELLNLRLSQRRGVLPEVWVHIFKYLCSEMKNAVNDSFIKSIYDEQLRQMYSLLSPGGKLQVEAILSTDRSVDQSWKNWRRGSSLLGKMLRLVRNK